MKGSSVKGSVLLLVYLGILGAKVFLYGFIKHLCKLSLRRWINTSAEATNLMELWDEEVPGADINYEVKSDRLVAHLRKEELVANGSTVERLTVTPVHIDDADFH